MRTLLTGATGLIGRRLVKELANPVVLTRDVERARRRLQAIEAHAWSAEEGPPPAAALERVEVVFNLAGEPLADGRWTAERKRAIRDSRVKGTRNLVAGLAVLDKRPKVLVSASAVGYYGERGDEALDETSPAGQGFLSEVCMDWEREALEAERLGIRVVCVRNGMVLASEGGALKKILTPFRMGAGGKIGSGKQWMPWIHIDDAVGIMIHASREEQVPNAINAVGPLPATNAQFTRALGRALKRPALFTVPAEALRLALGEMSEVLTVSQKVFPKVAQRTGYQFKYPDLERALSQVLS